MVYISIFYTILSKVDVYNISSPFVKTETFNTPVESKSVSISNDGTEVVLGGAKRSTSDGKGMVRISFYVYSRTYI